MILPNKETKEMFEQIEATAMLYGFALIKYDLNNGFDVIKPEQYDDLIAAINWQKDNTVKL